MTTKRHPIADANLHVFKRLEADGIGLEYVARFYPYKTWVILFQGNSLDDVTTNAEKFRAKVIADNESAYLANEARKVERAEQRKKKAEASQ